MFQRFYIDPVGSTRYYIVQLVAKVLRRAPSLGWTIKIAVAQRYKRWVLNYLDRWCNICGSAIYLGKTPRDYQQLALKLGWRAQELLKIEDHKQQMLGQRRNTYYRNILEHRSKFSILPLPSSETHLYAMIIWEYVRSCYFARICVRRYETYEYRTVY